MDITEIAVMFGLNLILCGVFTFLWRYLMDYRRDRRYAKMEEDIFNLQQQIASAKGVEARSERKEAVNAALADLALALQDPNADKGKVIQALIAKHPMAAMEIAKKLGIGL